MATFDENLTIKVNQHNDVKRRNFPNIIQEAFNFLCNQCDGCPRTENESEKKKALSKFKVIASHCVALFTIIMFKFAHGFDTGFTTILLPELYKPDAEIYITRDQLTWFSSSFFLPPIGAIVGGFLTQFIGCRMLLLICGALYTTSGLTFYWSINAAMILSAQAIAGFASSMIKGPCFTFLAEISLPQFRSILLGCEGVSVLLGSFTSTTLGAYLYWRTLVLINITFPILGLILICFVPESPYWLASKNRYQDAVQSLAWFRGWTSPDHVEDEIHSTLSNLQLDNSSSLADIKTNANSSAGRLNHLKVMSIQLFKRSFYIPFLTMLFVFAVNNCNGTSSLHIFSVLVFEKINTPIDPHTAAIFLSAARTIGAIISTFLVNITGKRKLLLITLVCCSILLIVVAVFVYLTSTNKLTDAAYHWIPMISIIMADFSNCIGIHKICLFLNSEIFPLHLRHIGVGAGHFINSISNSAMNKVFLYVLEGITVSGAYLCFSVVNIIGFVGIYFIVPETEGKSLKEIEDYYVDGNSLRKSK